MFIRLKKLPELFTFLFMVSNFANAQLSVQSFEELGCCNLINKKRVREADLVWMKTVYERVYLDREFNEPLNTVCSSNELEGSFFDLLKKIVLSDTSVQTFFPDPFSEQQLFEQNISSSELKSLLLHLDTLILLTDSSNVIDSFRINSVRNFFQVIAYDVKSQWYIDYSRSVMDSRVVGICPIILMRESEDVIVRPLFWLYYPDIEPYLKNIKVSNFPLNESEMSYARYINEHWFQGLITKIPNIYDSFESERFNPFAAETMSKHLWNELKSIEAEMWKQVR
jgi:gliding motility associated protien GldN